MTRILYLIVLTSFLYAVFLTTESICAKRDRKKLRHVIYVNGTRGKSGVTRLIDAGLRAGGIRVVSKTTGTVPIFFHVDGTQAPVRRRGPANIREQLRLLRLAAREEAEVLVIECMALEPQLQWVSQHRMLRADIGVITNARLDHTDVMGDTTEEILQSMMQMLPVNGYIFTAEKTLYPAICRKAEQLGSRPALAVPDGAEGDFDFPENISLALLVCEHLGVDREKARRAMRDYPRDPYTLRVHTKGAMTLINALSANDVTSLLNIYHEHAPKGEVSVEMLINNRADRPARARDMVRLAAELSPARIFLLGEQRQALRRYLRRAVPEAELVDISDAKRFDFHRDKPTVLLAAGNIKNDGIIFYEAAEQYFASDSPTGSPDEEGGLSCMERL